MYEERLSRAEDFPFIRNPGYGGGVQTVSSSMMEGYPSLGRLGWDMKSVEFEFKPEDYEMVTMFKPRILKRKTCKKTETHRGE